MKNFRTYLREDIAVYKPQDQLKPAEYKKIKIFRDGWQNIQLPSPPPEETEIDKVISECHGATERDKEEYKNCDLDAYYYIKDYMKSNNLEFDESTPKYIGSQCVPIIRHYKNFFNRPRPYQVAAFYNKELRRFKTGTASTPSYPSGHTVQPLVVALHYSKKYPEHKNSLLEGAKICGYGRVLAGLHYPTDYEAGVKLAQGLMEYIDYDKF